MLKNIRLENGKKKQNKSYSKNLIKAVANVAKSKAS